MDREDPWDEDGGDELEAEIMRADRAFGAERPGTTAEEARSGETLEQELAEERPGREPIDEALELVDEAVPDTEIQLVAEGDREQDPFASPEEAALSVRDDAPGATDHDDPHPVDEA